MDNEPYIAKIVACHRTGNGNLFCREEGKSEGDHPLDWPIFVGADCADKMIDLPIFGIVVTDYNTQFFNGRSRPTCRVLSRDRSLLEKIFDEEDRLNSEAEETLQKIKDRLTEWPLRPAKDIARVRQGPEDQP